MSSGGTAEQERRISAEGVPHICAHFRFGVTAAEANGGDRRDVHRPHPVQGQCDLKAVRGVQSLVDAMHRIYGNLENAVAGNMVLHTQADFLKWRRIFVSSTDYARIYNAAARQNGSEPLLMVVRPVAPAAADMRGRRRFYCADLPVSTEEGKVSLRPYIVCHTKAIAAAVQKNATMLVAARPGITPADRRDPHGRGDTPVPVFLHVTHRSQIAVIDDRYWRPMRPEQIPLFDGMKP